MNNLTQIATAFDIVDPKAINQNLQLRLLVNDMALRDKDFQIEVKEMALRDWHLMFNLFFWTYDPRQGGWHEPHEKPFVTWEYQDQFLKSLVEDVISIGEDCHIDKSRDMGLSWMVICAIIFFWMQPRPGQDFLLGSRKFEFVDKRGAMDTLIEKVRYVIQRLPAWLLPDNYDSNKHDNIGLIRNPQTGNIIKGEANNANFGTGGRYMAMLYDEFSKWTETDEQAWTSGFQASKCRIALSTPWGGPDRKFHHLKKDPNILHFTLPWYKHPHKDTKWYAHEAKRCTPLELAQEIDISYEGAAGKAFCVNYSPPVHRKKLDTIAYAPVQRLWDFGFHHPLCLFTQIENDVRWIWLKVILGKDVIINDFATYVKEMSEKWFPDAEYFEDVGDPAGNQKSDKSARTSIQLVQDATGIKIRTKNRESSKGVPLNVHRVQTAKRFQQLFSEFWGSLPRIMINEEVDDVSAKKPFFVETQSMDYVHRALVGGLHYPLDDNYAEVYEKDGFFDHLGDVARYGTFMYFPRPLKSGFEKTRSKEKEFISHHRDQMKEIRDVTFQRGAQSRRPTRFAHRVEGVGRFR